MSAPVRELKDWKKFYSYQNGKLELMFRRSQDGVNYLITHDYWVKQYKSKGTNKELTYEGMHEAAYSSRHLTATSNKNSKQYRHEKQDK